MFVMEASLGSAFVVAKGGHARLIAGYVQDVGCGCAAGSTGEDKRIDALGRAGESPNGP